MSIHVCKQCGDKFEYCRACVFRPIRYKDAGFCSKNCYEASKNKIEEVVPVEDVEVVVINEEDTSAPIEEAIEYPIFFTEVETPIIATEEVQKPKKKRNKIVEEVQKENNEDENQQSDGSSI